MTITRLQFLARSFALLLASTVVAAATGGAVADYDQQQLDELSAKQAELTPAEAQAALWRAAHENSPKTVAWLLQHGANADAQDESGKTALILNVLGARHDDTTIEQLEKAFKDLPPWPGEDAKTEQATFELLLKSTHEIDARDGKGITALLYAAALKRFDIVLRLHAAGADLNAKSTGGEAPIFYAPPATLATLVKLGADINATDARGGTVLHRAMRSLCDDRLRDYVDKATKAGARDSMNTKGQWASEVPDPGFCPTLDFGPNGLSKQLALVEAVRKQVKATRPKG